MKLAAKTLPWLTAAAVVLFLWASAHASPARSQEPGNDEIAANLAGGRVIIFVTRDNIVFAAIDQPLETKSVPPRVIQLDSAHVGVLLGASEWQMPADPKPVRLDRNFKRMAARDPRYQVTPGEAEPDLEDIGVAFLEKLRPLASQLHHKIELGPEEPLFQVVVIGYAPENYGPEVWLLQYLIEQEQVGTKGEYLQTRVQRPHFTQLYPPEKHQPRTLIEVRYPAELKGSTLLNLLAGDSRIGVLRAGDPRFSKAVDAIEKGQAQKASPADAADFLRAALPIIAGKARYVLATMEEQHGFDWIVPPDEPIEKATEDKDRPPDAPTLRRKPQP